MELTGIHHVTAISGNAQANLDFYTRVLGLRLVKKSVNQDVINTYHLFYADEVGSPGTDMTFFEWPDVPRHVPGSGDVVAVGFAVPDRAALDWWQQRFDDLSVRHGSIEKHAGRDVLPFSDAEGQRLELVAGPFSGTRPWSAIAAQYAIRGIATVRLAVRSIGPTAGVLTELLGFREVEGYTIGSVPVHIFTTGPGGLGTEVHVEERPEMPAQQGIGGVHHVAFRTPTAQEHEEWQKRIKRRLPVTPVIDRYYFKALYFREPGGVLFEISTDGPGFATDEDASHLGERLSLPPFLESKRAEIEAALPPLETAALHL